MPKTYSNTFVHKVLEDEVRYSHGKPLLMVDLWNSLNA